MKNKKNDINRKDKRVPDTNQAILYFMIMLFAVFTALISNSKLSGEDDLFWYLSTGRYIVQTGDFPSTDVFGFSTEGSPWIPFEWLWDVINFLIHSAAGFIGLSLFATIIILLIFYLQYNLMLDLKVRQTHAVIFMILMIFGMMPRLSVKPHLASYLFITLTLFIIVRYHYLKYDKKILYFLPLIFLIWANMHMGVMSGLLLLGLFVTYRIVYYFVSEKNEANKQNVIILAVIGIISVLVTLINPHGLNTYYYAFHIVSMQQLDIIYEWVSPFHTINQGQLFIYIYYLFLAGALFVLYYSLIMKDWLPSLLVFGFILHSMRAVRLTVDYLLVSGLFIAMSVWYLIAGKKAGRALSSRTAQVVVIVILLILIISIPGNYLYKALNSNRVFGTGVDPVHFPVRMFEFIGRSKISAIGERPFNNYENGGYFAWSFPGKKNFIGSRGINDTVWNDYSKIINMQEGFEELIKNKYKFDYFIWSVPYLNFYENPAILQNTIIAYLSINMGEWRVVYWDENSIVFVQDDTPFFTTMIENGYAYITPYNFYFNRNFLEQAITVDKQLIKREIDRKITQEPNNRIIQQIKKEIYDRVK